MKTDNITWGETYDLSVSAQDANGAPIALDTTWLAACRFTRSIGGTAVFSPTLTIAAGVATASIDTGATGWEPGVWYYDVRITDPTGNDFWCEPVQLTISNRNTPNT